MIPIIIINGNKKYAEALQLKAKAETRLADAEEQIARLMAEQLATEKEMAKNPKSKTTGSVPPPLPIPPPPFF